MRDVLVFLRAHAERCDAGWHFAGSPHLGRVLRMRRLGLSCNFVDVQVRVVEDRRRPAADAPQRVVGEVLPHLVAADSAQLRKRALDRRFLPWPM
jgi:hypothetical protein